MIRHSLRVGMPSRASAAGLITTACSDIKLLHGVVDVKRTLSGGISLQLFDLQKNRPFLAIFGLQLAFIHIESPSERSTCMSNDCRTRTEGAFKLNREQHGLALQDSLFIEYARSEGPAQAAFHFHDDYEIYLFLGGDVEFYVEHSMHRLRRGHLILCNDKELHRIRHLGQIPYERIAIRFDHRVIGGLSTPFTNLLGCFQNRPLGVGNVVQIDEERMAYVQEMSLRLSEVLQSDRYGSDVLAAAYLSELLVWINQRFREKEKDPCFQPAPIPLTYGRIADIMAYIEERLSEELSLGQIADHFGVDPSHLSYLFKQQTGSTLYQYILIKRIAVAKRHLSQGVTVTEACGLSGFRDYSNFIRTFKKLTGVSPGKYNAKWRA
ncbi:hypothetical protein B9G55_11530 [Saccharibacillus sp. O16]|nr:hypothetical protein B9G55_11530 [Saccharibacillus sp. O16]